MVDTLKVMDSLTVADGVGNSMGAEDTAAAVDFTIMLSGGAVIVEKRLEDMVVAAIGVIDSVVCAVTLQPVSR